MSQIGPVTQTLDPIFQESTTFSHQTTAAAEHHAEPDQALISNTARIYSGTYQQGLSERRLSHGQLTAINYLNENSPTDVLNPSVAHQPFDLGSSRTCCAVSARR